MENYTVSFRAMGTTVQAWLAVEHPGQAALLQQVPIWFEEWEARFSRFRPTSELTYVNNYAGQWVGISADMSDVIGRAIESSQATHGLFNPLVLPALLAAGYDKSFDKIADKAHVARTESEFVAVADWHTIEHDGIYKRVRIPANAKLDLGGIVKGWAAQQAADRLYTTFGPCLVDAGGDIVAHGSPDDSPGWQIGLPRQRDGEEIIGTIVLTDSSVATSGIDFRRWVQNGHEQHHLIDPRTGQPAATDVLSATAVTPTGVESEIWAKTTLITGSCELAQNTGYAALIVHRDLSLSTNALFEALCPIPDHQSPPRPSVPRST